MTTTTTGWVVKKGEGHLYYTFAAHRGDSIKLLMQYHKDLTWQHFEGIGYRCVKAKQTIETI